MSHCRFQNTLMDLRDCRDALNEMDGEFSDLSEEELSAMKRLIGVCKYIAVGFGEHE